MSQGTHKKPPSLQFVTIASLYSIECLPSFSPFTSLKFLKVVDCQGLIQPPSVQHCSSLKRLWLTWFPRQKFLPNLNGLTSLRDLTIDCGLNIDCGLDSLSYKGRALKLEGLSSLTSLGALDLRSIPVEDLSGLENLTCVEYIYLDHLRLTTLASLFNLARSSLIVLTVDGLNSSWPETVEELDELQLVIKYKLQGLVARVNVNVPDTPCKIWGWHVLGHPVVNAIENVRGLLSNAKFCGTAAVMPFMGVRYDHEQSHENYVAEIRPALGSKKVCLGAYETAEEAAYVYDIANLRYKRNLPLNYPNSPHLLKDLESKRSVCMKTLKQGGVSHSKCLEFLKSRGSTFMMRSLDDKHEISSLLLMMADNLMTAQASAAAEPPVWDMLNMSMWYASLCKLIKEMETVQMQYPSVIENTGVYVVSSAPYDAFLRALAAEMADRPG